MNTRAKHQIQRDGRAQGRHAVVLGGSLAGLLAARVLADHFEEVTLIERDAYPGYDRHPQGNPAGQPRSWTARAGPPDSRRTFSRRAGRDDRRRRARSGHCE